MVIGPESAFIQVFKEVIKFDSNDNVIFFTFILLLDVTINDVYGWHNVKFLLNHVIVSKKYCKSIFFKLFKISKL